MGLRDKIKKIVAPQREEPEQTAVPVPALLCNRLIYTSKSDFHALPTRVLVALAPFQDAQREALLQRLDKLDKLMYFELGERCWQYIAWNVRVEYEHERAKARDSLKRGATLDKKTVKAIEEQILAGLADKHRDRYQLNGLHLLCLETRFFTLPESDTLTNDLTINRTDMLTDNLLLTRAMLRSFLRRYFAGELTEYECEIYFVIMLTEQARGLEPTDLTVDTYLTQIITDTTGMGEKEKESYLHFYEVTKSYVRRWYEEQKWSYFLEAWSPFE